MIQNIKKKHSRKWDIKYMGEILDKEYRKSLTENASFKGYEGVRHEDTWGKNIPSRRNSKCKGAEVGTYLGYLQNSNKASVFRGTE